MNTVLPGYTRTVSLSAVEDADGLKQSFTDPSKATVYTWSNMDGAFKSVAEGFGGAARTVSVTTSSKTGNYGSPIVVTGKRGGVAVSESLTMAANGGETVRGAQPFDFPDPTFKVAVPAGGGGGTMTFGVQDVYAPKGSTFAAFRVLADGDAPVGYQGGYTDTIPSLAASVQPYRIERVLRTISVGIQLIWDAFTKPPRS